MSCQAWRHRGGAAGRLRRVGARRPEDGLAASPRMVGMPSSMGASGSGVVPGFVVAQEGEGGVDAFGLAQAAPASARARRASRSVSISASRSSILGLMCVTVVSCFLAAVHVLCESSAGRRSWPHRGTNTGLVVGFRMVCVLAPWLRVTRRLSPLRFDRSTPVLASIKHVRIAGPRPRGGVRRSGLGWW
jgi:hypothetical protein